MQGKKLPVYGDGKNVRDWLFVEDHAKAIDMVQEQGRLFETYNVGGHNEKQNIEIINIIIDTLQEMLPADDPRRALVSKDLITYVEDRRDMTEDMQSHRTRSRRKSAGIRRPILQLVSRRQSHGSSSMRTG